MISRLSGFFNVSVICISLIASFSNFETYAQQKSSIRGTVFDSLSSQVLAYATISIFSVSDNKLVNGNISDDKGNFSVDVPYGNYYAEISFIGYLTMRTKQFSVIKNQTLSLGSINLSISSEVLNEVVVQGEKSSMELLLDKKVFNVGTDLANSGGTASDILRNIPSVAVDPEGNVQLRGSGNVKILIDGKPSGLVSFKGGSGLEQLQASMIERVEVITNPSARYEAEGQGGIINIVLKKDQTEGFNGSVDAIVGNPANYGLAANLNFRHKKINFFINYGAAYRVQNGRGSLYQEVYDNDTTFILQQTSKSGYSGINNNIRGGVDIFLTEKSILTGSYLYRGSNAHRTATIVYNDYYNSFSDFKSQTVRTQDEDETEPNSEYSIIYKRILEGNGHELLGEVKYLDNKESSDQKFDQHTYDSENVEDVSKLVNQRSVNDETEKQLLFQVDYTKPFSTNGKFEAGLRSSFRNMTNDFLVTDEKGGSSIPVPGLDNKFIYYEKIVAAYGIFGNKSGRISYQGGVRSELTGVNTTLQETGETNPRNYFNLFPSAHLTFDLGKENKFQLSYSRRIGRPSYNDLTPFITFTDNRNYFSGNPNLNPEYSDVYEIGYLKNFENTTFSSSVYNRRTKDKIERIRTVDETGNSVTRPENLNSNISYGVEVTGSFEFTKWWNLGANFNFFHAAIDGTNLMANYKTTTYSWFVRQTSKFDLPGNFNLQIRGNYEAPQKTVQGSRKALYYMDISLSKEILKGKGTLNLNTLDVFNTRKNRSIFEGDAFYSESSNQMRRRQVNLTFSYRINKSKAPRKQRDETVQD